MKILVVNHQKDCNAERFQPWLEEAGFDIDNRLGASGQLPAHIHYSTTSPAHDHFAAMIVTGGKYNLDGSGGAWWLPHTGELIREAISQDMPVLGICLGAQLIAYALGGLIDGCRGRVQACTKPFEFGPVDILIDQAGQADPLFTGLGNRIVMHENHQAYIQQLPDGAELLAHSDRCPVEAFRYGRYAYGLQFHPEVAVKTVFSWQPERINTVVEAGMNWQHILDLAEANSEINEAQSRQICQNFINIIRRRTKLSD